MRLVYLAQSIVPSREANSIHVMKMCRSIASSGVDVSLFVPRYENVELSTEEIYAFYGVEHTFSLQKLAYPNTRGQATVAACHAAWLLTRSRPDLLYSRALDLCERVMRLVSVPFVLEMHASVEPALVKKFERLIGNPNFRFLVVISRALQTWFTNAYPELTDRIVVAPDAADSPTVDINPVDLRRDGRLLAGYCGQLFEGKGIGVILELARAMSNVDFHVIGGTDIDVAEWRGRSTGIDNLVFHGFLPHPEAQRYIAAFDVALAPYQPRVTLYDGDKDIAPWMSPLKLFEYMAAGKAIICSDLPVLGEVLVDGENALLCAPENTEAWANALERLSDSSERKRIADNAQRDFHENYTWDQRARKILIAAEEQSQHRSIKMGRSPKY